MTTTLEITFDGLCLYCPDIPAKDVLTAVLISTKPLSTHTHPHVGFIDVDERHVQVPGGAEISRRLDREDIQLFDGSTPIPVTTQTRDLAGIIRLMGKPFNFNSVPPGVDPSEQLSEFCSARLQLPGGDIKTIDETLEDWDIVHEDDLTGSHPEIARKKLRQGLKYTRELANDWMDLKILKDGTLVNEYRLREVDGKIRISIGNTDVPPRFRRSGIKNRSLDFNLVYHLYQLHDFKPKFFPQESDVFFGTPEGHQLPCVGGCTC